MVRPAEVTVYIVGDASALGVDIARGFVREGIQRIGLICPDTESGDRAAEQVRSMAPGLWSLSSVAHPSELPAVRRAMTELGAALGPANIVVHLVRTTGQSPSGNLRASPHLDELITVGRAALAPMRAEGSGALVAVAAAEPDGGTPDRSGSAAVVTASAIAFGRTLEMAVESDGVSVNVLVPDRRGRQSDAEVAALVLSSCGLGPGLGR